jgi:hypothetical protein
LNHYIKEIESYDEKTEDLEIDLVPLVELIEDKEMKEEAKNKWIDGY